MIHCLYAGSSSVCFEFENTSPYYNPQEYTVKLEGETVYSGNENVFSLFGLRPETDYEAEICFKDSTEKVQFRTAAETCCVNIREFGALGDGVNEDTAVIQAAINMIPDGGRLYFPKGTYLTMPLTLRSRITIELDEGAVLLGSTDRTRYPIIPATVTDAQGKETPFAGFEGIEEPCYQSLIQGAYVTDVAIVGKGKIDGNGQNGDWWKEFRNFPAKRPRAIFLNRCRNITLHGITVANSPSWHLHPYFSENIRFLDVFVTAPKISPNTDAIDPESCRNVDIIGCSFSVGDDCIAVKSGKFDMARKYKVPAQDHTIRNCLMQFGHGALTLGSELSAGIRNVSVTQCVFRETDRGLRIKTRRGRGKDSIINEVVFDNIRMEKVKTPIVINMWYNCVDPDAHSEYVWSRKALPVDDRTPHMGHFAFRNMECVDVEAAACWIDGLPESPIEKVELENISVTFAEDAKPFVPAMHEFAEPTCRMGLYLDNVKEVTVQNVTLKGTEGEPVIAQHCGEVTLKEFNA
ncbi:MAG: glycoside hydrolase family 28 protein [Solobacterium sp.]|nr:glycoside hydrolase family 28 protein [Solobacterium sp.]